MLRNIFSQRNVTSSLTEIASTPGLPQPLARKLCLQHRSTEQCIPSAIPGKPKGDTYNLQISVKLTKDVFLVPTLTTCGGFMTNFRFSPATMSGFFSRMMLNTLFSNCKTGDHTHVSISHFSKHLTSKIHLKQHSQ